jgi:hypothetical protein
MAIIKGIARLFIDQKKGSGTIYLKKEFVEKLNIQENSALPEKEDLFVEFDTEGGILCIKKL